jgi:hypothetical protein
MLGTFILPDNFGHSIKVEEKFHLCLNIFGHSGKIKIFTLPENLGQIIEAEKVFVAAHHFGCILT